MNRAATTRQAEDSEKLYEFVFRHAPDIFLMVSTTTGKILDCNLAAETQFRGSRAELVGKTTLDISPEYQPNGMRSLSFGNQLIQRALHEDGLSFEWLHTRLDGSALPVEVCLTVIPYQGGEAFFCTLRDITRRREMEAQLRDSEARFRTLFSESPDPYCIMELEGGRISECNVAMERLLGGTHAQVIGKTPDVLSPPFQPDGLASLAGAQLKIEAVLRDGRHRFDWVHRRFDGSDFMAEVTVALCHYADRQVMFVAWRDISDRVQIERALRDSERVLNAAQAIAHVGSWDWEIASDKLTWSAECYRIFGLAQHTPMSYPKFLQFVHADDRLGVERAVAQALAQRAEYYVEHRIELACGERRYLEERGTVECDATGQPLRMVGTVLDITTRKLLADKLAAHQEKLEQLVAQRTRELQDANQALQIAAAAFDAQEGIMITDAQERILRVNRAFEELTGFTAGEIIGKTPRILKSGRHDAPFYAAMWEQILRNGFWKGELWERRKSGEIYPKLLSITAIKNAQGVTTHYVSTQSDISASKAAEETIRQQAFHDPLTHLPNRRLLLERLAQALSSCAQTGRNGALLFIDLDHFKNLNDTLGHDVGDQLLIQVAQRIVSCVRSVDTVARLGGDEFIVLLTELDRRAIDAATEAKWVGRKILDRLNQNYELVGHEYLCSASIGVALFSERSRAGDELLKQADIAMYQVKTSGRNGISFFDPDMQSAINQRFQLERELRKAIARDQLRLHYQIQLDAQQVPIGAEALIRWHHPERGLILPGQFIPFAEESSLILSLGAWVLEAACQQLANWQLDEHLRHLQLSINVSAQQFKTPDFLDTVKRTVRAYAIDSTRLKLELTESVILQDVEQVIAKMSALRALGIGLSLDDFGTGYSSLSYLKRLPINQLKIDQSFVRDIASDPNDAILVKTIIDLAGNFALEVIAEGVETAQQLAFLQANGCTTYQGYLFGKPQPIEQFERDFAHWLTLAAARGVPAVGKDNDTCAR